jgi:hypothetical protein
MHLPQEKIDQTHGRHIEQMQVHPFDLPVSIWNETTISRFHFVKCDAMTPIPTVPFTDLK